LDADFAEVILAVRGNVAMGLWSVKVRIIGLKNGCRKRISAKLGQGSDAWRNAAGTTKMNDRFAKASVEKSESNQLNPNEITFRIASGTIAVLGLIAVPTMAGLYLDRLLGWMVWTPVGLVAGMIFATVVLLRLARRWTPIARRSKNEILVDDPSDSVSDESMTSEEKIHD
jgi:hypothetical protein